MGTSKLISKYPLHSSLISDKVTSTMPEQILVKKKKKGKKQTGGTTALHSLLCLPINFLL